MTDTPTTNTDLNESFKTIMHPLSLEEGKAFLDALFGGELTMVYVESPREIFAGNVEYAVSNGWKVWIFNDCDSWDYIDSIESPDGKRAEYGEEWANLFDRYAPTEEQEKAWGFDFGLENSRR